MLTLLALLRTTMYTYVQLCCPEHRFALDSVSKALKLRIVFCVKGEDFIKMSYSVVHNLRLVY